MRMIAAGVFVAVAGLASSGRHGAQAARAPAQESDATGPAFMLRVVDESERAVGGATACFMDIAMLLEDIVWKEPGDVLGEALDGLCTRRGKAYVSDATGVVLIPRNDFGGICLVEEGGRSGLAYFGPVFDHHSELAPGEDESATVVLIEELALDVRVVDPSARPAAGIPVALRFRGDEQVADFFRTLSGKDGRARLRHLQVALEDRTVPSEGGAVCAALALLAVEPVEVTLRAGPLPRETIVLVAPPTGALEVVLEDADGRPLAIDAWIELEIAAGERSAHDEWRRRFIPRSRDDRRLRVIARDGRARIDAIGLTLDLDVRVEPRKGYRPVTARGRGPQLPGEVALVRIPVVERISVLAARLVDPAGAAWASRALEGALWLDSPQGDHGCGARVRTDAAGRFELEIDAGWPLAGTYALRLWSDEPDGRRRWTAIEENDLVPGENDLGARVIEPLPILAQGRVLDAAEAPLAGAGVGLVDHPDGWQEGWIGADTTDAEGHFCLQAPANAPRVRLAVTRAGHVPQVIEVAACAEDVELRLAASGSLAGSVLVPRAETLDALRVVATHESGAIAELDLRADSSEFVFSDVAPGRYDVAFRLDEEPEFTLVVPGVVVEAGQVCRNAQLQALDLRGRLRTFELELVAPWEEYSVWAFHRRRPAGSGPFRSGADWTLDSLFTTSHPALDLRITAEDARTVELLGVAEDRTVELRPGFALVVRLLPPVSLGEEEWLELELESREGAPLPKLFGPRFFDGESTKMTVPEPGTYLVQLEFLQQADGDLRSTTLPLEPGCALLVEERDEPQRLEIRLTDATLRAIGRARADPPVRAKKR